MKGTFFLPRNGTQKGWNRLLDLLIAIFLRTVPWKMGNASDNTGGCLEGLDAFRFFLKENTCYPISQESLILIFNKCTVFSRPHLTH